MTGENEFFRISMTVINIKSLIRQVRRDREVSTIQETDIPPSKSEEIIKGFTDDLPSRHDSFEDICTGSLSGVKMCNEYLSITKAAAVFHELKQLGNRSVVLRGRRCIPYGGRVLPEGLVYNDDIPSWLKLLMAHVYETTLKHMGLPAPNHALVNLYNAGDGIMPHEDGTAYTPYAAVVSLGAGCVFDFVSKCLPRVCVARIYLPVGSLMVFSSDAYAKVLHEFRFSRFDAIDDSVCNHMAINQFPERLGGSVFSGENVLSRGERISITMRHVPNYIS